MTHRDTHVVGGIEEVIEDIRGQLSQIQFGSLEISVHNGKVVQIERREKKRYEKREQQQTLR